LNGAEPATTIIEIEKIRFRLPADAQHRFALWILKIALIAAILAYVWRHEISKLF
jgi:hypothetical protein